LTQKLYKITPIQPK